MPTGTLFMAFAYLLGVFILTVLSTCLREIRKQLSKRTLNELGSLFFYRSFQRYFFPKKELDTLYVATVLAKSILTFLYAATAISFLYKAEFLPIAPLLAMGNGAWLGTLGALVVFILCALLFGDFLPRAWSAGSPKMALRISSPIGSLFLYACFPLSYVFLKLSQLISHLSQLRQGKEPSVQMREKIVGLIQEAIATKNLDASEKKLIESVVTFKDRIVREVMVPRVDIYSVSADLSIREAATMSLGEGFSRIPVYKDTVDNIVGLLMYKDVLELYVRNEKNQTSLDAPIGSLVKPVLYTPETKKISLLLQEFRNKQMHMAIVVDEYGGTEGIVTIEDILEEIVGEIEDEYDKEEKLFAVLPHGGWVVDARMSILDIEEELGLSIPQDGEYDTIGGYIFHRAGAIPSKGLLIHHDDFELEILSSNDRSIKKIRITPLAASHEESTQSMGT